MRATQMKTFEVLKRIKAALFSYGHSNYALEAIDL
jgi:hypothetical protein